MNKLDKNIYTKSRLIKELAFRSGIKQTASKQLLEVLTEIAYREIKKGPFVIPGLCKLELCDRKARKLRNPRTGEQLIMPPHKALRITASKRAKLAVAPQVTAVPADSYVPPTPVAEPAPEAAEKKPPVVESVPVTEPAAVSEPVVAAETVAAPEPAVAADPVAAAEPVEAEEQVPAAEAEVAADVEQGAEEMPVPEEGEPDTNPITFRCPECEQEIEAPRDCIDQEAECPMCGCIVFVPPKSEPGTMYGPAVAGEEPKAANEVVTAKAAENMDPALLKNCTIRIDASVLSGLTTEPPKPEPAEAETMISFFCKKCHQEIEASLDMIGTTAECPNCGAPIEVPAASEKEPAVEGGKDNPETDKKLAEAQKHSTMRIDLGDDF